MSAGHDYKGIIPALALPLKADLSIDEADLRRLSRWLAGQKGIAALMTNGHTGDVFSLTWEERAQVTRIVADEVKGKVPIISAVSAEGIKEGIQQAEQQKAAGADAIDVMPPHHWLRFGMRPNHVIDYFAAIGESTGLDLAVHVYPSWTRAAYSLEVLSGLAKLKWVKLFKVGTREMNKYARDIQIIRQCAPDKAVLTCHDEYLLASMVQGVDGGLLGFASLIPELICELMQAVWAGDLKRAQDCQARINPLKRTARSRAAGRRDDDRSRLSRIRPRQLGRDRWPGEHSQGRGGAAERGDRENPARARHPPKNRCPGI